MKRERKRGEAEGQILDRLRSSPAFSKKIADDLGIRENVVHYNLKKL